MKYVVEYIDERTEARRTAVVDAETPDDKLIPFKLREQGRRVRKILFTHPEGKKEEVTRWT